MSFLIACYWCATATLLLAGIAKLLRPSGLADLLPRRLPQRAIARLIGATEVTVSLAALAGVAYAPAVVALTFAGLAVGAEIILRRTGSAPCGCFGSTGSRLSLANVLFSASAAAVAAATAVLEGHEAIAPLALIEGPLQLLLAVQIATAAWLTTRLFSEAAATWDIWNNPWRESGR